MYNKHRERQSRKGYAISLFYEITPMACKHGRYFFMVKINTISVIRYIIIYVYTIAITSFHGDDGITPDGSRRRLRLCLCIFYRIFRYFSTLFIICNRNVMRCVEGAAPYKRKLPQYGCRGRRPRRPVCAARGEKNINILINIGRFRRPDAP